MARAPRPRPRRPREIEYPTGDGKPLAETGTHVAVIIDTLQVLWDYFADQSNVKVSGNLLLYYEEGNPRKRVAPDVFVVFGVPKEPPRENFLVWKEGKAPDAVIEITSKSTRHEDLKKKWVIYRDILRVSEYFLFDPKGDYLAPPLQGFRLVDGDYVPIDPVAGQLPSAVLGLCLVRDGKKLRLWDPATTRRLPTRLEALEEARRRAEEAHHRAEEAHHRAEEAHHRAEEAHHRAEAADRRAEAEAARRRDAEEIDRLRREIEDLRRR